MVQLKLTDEQKEVLALLPHFNSIMVQLNLFIFVLILCVTINFNSIMVQLKRKGASYDTLFDYNFNSIMVQLKPIDIYNGNLVFTEVSLRINVYFFAVKMSMYNESIFADLRQHLHLIFIVKG